MYGLIAIAMTVTTKTATGYLPSTMFQTLGALHKIISDP